MRGLTSLILFIGVVTVSTAQFVTPSPDKLPDPVPMSSLRGGVAKVDITPPIGIPLAGYADRKGPSTGIHDPLHAAVIVFDNGRTRAALITLDLIGVDEAEGERIRAGIGQSSGIPAGNILINYSHTHGSPSLEKDAAWRDEVIAKVIGATKLAASRMRPVSLGYGEGAIDFNINRRVITPEGKCIAGLNPSGVCDRRLKVLRIDADDSIEPMAVLMHAVCHANVYRVSNTEVTADFPGPAKHFVERNFSGRTVALFLQGCSGNVRANLPGAGAGYTNRTGDFGRSGNEVDMAWAGGSLGAETIKVATRLRVREQVRTRSASVDIAGGAQMLRVTADLDRHKSFPHPRNKVSNGKIDFPIRALRIGDVWLVALPGEPVVEYALQIEEGMRGMGKVMVLGYTSGDASYVPVAHMIKEGGYEVEGGAYSEKSEQEILDGVKALVAQIRGR